MNRLLRITLKGVGFLLAFIIIIFLLIWLALQFPAVQNYAVDKATGILSETTRPRRFRTLQFEWKISRNAK